MLLLLLLSLGLVNANVHSFNNTASLSNASASHVCDGFTGAVTLTALDNAGDVQCSANVAVTPSPDNTNYHDSQTALQYNTFRRILSNDQDASSELEPVYHLLIDFFPPSLLAFVLAAIPLMDSTQHWTSTSSSPPSRLSGWKESNIQFSHFRDSLS
nr:MULTISPECIES: hypothetical protein [Vibrio]